MKTHALLAVVLASACAGSSDGGGGGGGGGGANSYQYVQTGMQVPQNDGQSAQLGLDLDDNGSTDNKLGKIFGLLASQGADVQGQIDELTASGQLVILHDIRADGIESDDGATWQVYLGNVQASPDFSGAGAFSIASNSPDDAMLHGAIGAGNFSGGPGNVTVDLPLGMVPITVHLVGTRIQGTVADTGCDVIMGGAITASEMHSVVVPAAADMINMKVQEDPAGAQNILLFLDSNDDGIVSPEEIEGNAFLADYLSPDVTIDGQPSVSLGVGVTTVKASF